MVITNATASAVEAWKARIEAHDAQSLRARGDQPEPADFWSTLAGGFRADPHRTDDPVVHLLQQWVTPDTTVLDVGGGAGRYALALALRCRQVTVVEPSPSMVGQLEEAARAAEISNVPVVQAAWEEAEVEAADLVLCANVVYGVKDIAPFVSKLDEKARERVVIVAWMDAPPSIFSPLWKVVHQEERIELPALPELLPVLWELGIFPNIEMLTAGPPRSAPNLEVALAMARLMLFVRPGSEENERLEKAAREMAVETADGVTLRGHRTRPQAVLSWRPKAEAPLSG
jgi:SAM-dependent methyltransferase